MLKGDQSCTRCPLNETTKYVCHLGNGPEPCSVMIIGDAPGYPREYLIGVLEDANIRQRFITNAVSCRPPKDHTITKREINACSHWLQYQIKKVRPKFVVLMGNTPLISITGKAGIKKMRGKPFKKDGIWYLPTYSPAYVVRGEYKDDPLFRADFALLKTLMLEGKPPEEESLSIKIVENETAFRCMLHDMQGATSFDIETTGLYPWAKYIPKKQGEKRKPDDPRNYDAKIISVGFGTRNNQWLINTAVFKLTPERLARLKDKLENDCTVIAHNGKFDALWMKVHYGVDIRIDFDTMIAHYLTDENTPHGLKELAQRLCNAPNWDVEGEAKREWSARLIKYHAHDLFYTRKLKFILARDLANDTAVKQVFDYIMMPVANIFVGIEYTGLYVDTKKMDAAEKHLRSEIAAAELRLNKWAKINWGSPKQVGEVLFVKFKITPTEVTKTGAASTSESALKQIDHPLVADLLKYRGAKQQLSFFIEGWKPYLVGSYIHPSFKLTGTVTGRLSAEHPNVQQIPRDSLIRSLITAPPGWVLLEADLSQIELRIAAELANERNLIKAFIDGKDPHWLTVMAELRRSGGQREIVLATASTAVQKKITNFDNAIDILLDIGPDAAVEIDKRWKELRKKAKAINFGYLFGMWWKKFIIYARDNYDVQVTDEEAQNSRKDFFKLYPDFEGWHKRQRKFANRNGYVRSLSGRKRRLPAAMGEDSPEKREAERQAINSPVQSFANEMNLMALIELRKKYSHDIYRPVATVHDAILAMVKVEHLVKIAMGTLAAMRHPQLLDELNIELRIPIDADIKIGAWSEGVSLKKWKEMKHAV